ncbi:MAG: cell division protein SepF [Spirulina sp. SIO3F2]|nr:cell division protein SepF [Spirulina sp. SIO3F2]
MNTIFNRIKDIMVGPDESEEYEYYEEDMAGNDYQTLYQQENQPEALAESERQRPRRTRERPAMPAAADSTANTLSQPSTTVTPTAARSNVIGMPGSANGISEVVVIEPRSFEEMPQVIQALRERKSVVLNLTIIDPDEAQRAVDFVAGGTYAIDGHQERIGESIFLFTPSCVQVSTQAPNVMVQDLSASSAAPGTVRPTAQPQPAQAANWALDPNRLAQ